MLNLSNWHNKNEAFIVNDSIDEATILYALIYCLYSHERQWDDKLLVNAS